MLHCCVRCYIFTLIPMQCCTALCTLLLCCIATDALLHCTPMQEFIKTDDGVANAMQAVIWEVMCSYMFHLGRNDSLGFWCFHIFKSLFLFAQMLHLGALHRFVASYLWGFWCLYICKLYNSKILFDHISIVAIGRMILNSDDNDDGNHEWF